MKPSPAPLKPRLKDILNELPYLPRAVALVWQAARPWTLAWLALLLVQGLLLIATVYLSRALVDSLVNALDDGPLQAPLTWVGLMALARLSNEILGSLSTWVRTAQAERVSVHIYGLIHTQASRLDLAFFETPLLEPSSPSIPVLTHEQQKVWPPDLGIFPNLVDLRSCRL